MMFRVDWSGPVRYALVTFLLLLTACATRPIQVDDVPPPPEAPAEDTSAELEVWQSSDLALNQLLNDAHRHLAAENWEAASASAERGLRIDRREPELYLVLARAYLGLADPRRALEFVRQGLRYAGNELSPVTADLKQLQASLLANEAAAVQ